MNHSLAEYNLSSTNLAEWLQKAGAVGPDAAVESYRRAYNTTNEVFLGSSYVIKRYVKQESLRAEIRALDVCATAGIKVPEVHAYVHNETLGAWAILQRLQGRELSQSQLGTKEARVIGAKIVRDLVVFEGATNDRILEDSQVWSVKASLRPFLNRLEEAHYLDLSRNLEFAAESADVAFSRVSLVNCMDIYFGNILLDGCDGHAKEVSHIDFDKSSRLVPEGEQLSHFAQFNVFSDHFNHFVDLYCDEKGIDRASVQAVFDISPFFRAVSGMRDSFSVMLRASQRVESKSHADIRSSVFKKGMETALKQISTAFGALNLSEVAISQTLRDLERLFSDLENK